MHKTLKHESWQVYNSYFVLLGGLYKGTQAPQGAAGSAYDAMSGAKIKILGDGNKKQ